MSASGAEICSCCVVAATPLQRLRGLLAAPAMEPGAGLLLRPCASVHTLFLRHPIDVVFLDSDGRVLRIWSALPPWRAVAQRGAQSVLELPAGACALLAVSAGDRLSVSLPP